MLRARKHWQQSQMQTVQEMSEHPQDFAPTAMTDTAESAGSSLICCCSAADSLLDVLKRFPALCC